MKKSVVTGAIAAVAVFAGVFYFAREPVQQAPDDARAKEKSVAAEEPRPAAAPRPGLMSSSAPPTRPVPGDPRLAALMASPDNAQIEYFSDAEGRVIKEIDKDPSSPGFGKPLREYTYAGKQVIRLVTYRYLGDQVQVTTADVVYKPDGSVDQYRESTR